MAENLIINGGNKRELYETLLPQLQSLTAGETDIIANMANVAAALKQTFDFFWVGFYIVKEEMLVLAPFQGPLACMRDSLERSTDDHRTGCGAVSGAYRL